MAAGVEEKEKASKYLPKDNEIIARRASSTILTKVSRMQRAAGVQPDAQPGISRLQRGVLPDAQPGSHHVLWGGIDTESSSRSSAELRQDCVRRTKQEQKEHVRGLSRTEKDLIRLAQLRIDPADIQFDEDSMPSSSSQEAFRDRVRKPSERGLAAAEKAPASQDRGAASSSPCRPPAAAVASQKFTVGADSGSDLDSGSDSENEILTDLERQQLVLRQQMMIEAASSMDLESMRAHVPLDSNGEPTSIGSIGHATGTCKVCIFAHSKPGCSNGVACSFCHFVHKRGRRKNKLRPCKGKRDRYRKLLNRLTNLIECDPCSFNMDKVELPPSIASNEVVRAKLMAKIQLHAEQVMADREAGVASSLQMQSHPPLHPQLQGSHGDDRLPAVVRLLTTGSGAKGAKGRGGLVSL